MRSCRAHTIQTAPALATGAHTACVAPLALRRVPQQPYTRPLTAAVVAVHIAAHLELVHHHRRHGRCGAVDGAARDQDVHVAGSHARLRRKGGYSRAGEGPRRGEVRARRDSGVRGWRASCRVAGLRHALSGVRARWRGWCLGWCGAGGGSTFLRSPSTAPHTTLHGRAGGRAGGNTSRWRACQLSALCRCGA